MDMPSTRRSARPRGIALAATLAALVLAAAGLAAPWYARPSVAPWFGGVFLVAAALIVAALWQSKRAIGDARAPAPTAITPTLAGANAVVASDELRRQLDMLRATQAELLRTKQAAEAAAMAKGEFLATMSHEIRTPLNGILPLLELVLSTELAADQHDYLSTAYASARELLRIVDAILDYSKLDAERLELETVGVNLRELVEGVAQLMQPTAEAKGLRVGVTIDPNVRLAVRGDPVRLRQVLTNLVSNAIKFTERGGVQIHVSKRGETRDRHEIVFAVRDSGIGIAPDAMQRLFRPFSQADASTTRVFGGTGLGLAICKRLVDLMHGRIGAKSEPGRGSLFWFTVPLLKAIGDLEVRRDLNGIRGLSLVADDMLQRRLQGFASALGIELTPASSPADALARLRAAANMGEKWRLALMVLDAHAVQATATPLVRNVFKDASLAHVRVVVFGHVGEDETELATEARFAELGAEFADDALRETLERLFDVESPTRLREDAPAPAIDVDTRKTKQLSGRVLLVEDNEINRRVAEKLLGLHGLEVVAVGNGQEAVDALERHRYDVVLMDCLMPVMDGFTAARTWREHERASGAPRIPILAMTANAMVGDRERCLASGMDDYLSKPLDRALLAEMLQRWLPKQRSAAAQARVVAEAVPAAVRVETRAPERAAIERTSVLDAAVIGDLLDTMGEEFGDLVRVYLEDAPARLRELAAAAEAGNAAAQVSPAHTLKSSSANIGATALSDLARGIEHAARTGALTPPEQIEKGIAREYARVAAELSALLETASR